MKRQKIAEPTPSTTLTIRLPVSLKQQLELAAKAQDRSVANFVVRALRASVDVVDNCNPCSSTGDACEGNVD